MHRLVSSVSNALARALARLGFRRRDASGRLVRPEPDTGPFDPDATLAALYAADNLSRAIRTLYARVDRAMSAGEFDKVDALLSRADTGRLDLDISVAILSVIAPARGKLPSFRAFYDRVLARLTEEDGEEEARGCLHGLGPVEPVLFRVRVPTDRDVGAAVASLARMAWIGRVTPAFPNDPDPVRRRTLLVEADPTLIDLQTLGAFPGFADAERVATGGPR